MSFSIHGFIFARGLMGLTLVMFNALNILTDSRPRGLDDIVFTGEVIRMARRPARNNPVDDHYDEVMMNDLGRPKNRSIFMSQVGKIFCN